MNAALRLPQKVLHVTAPARIGGLESVVVQLCAGLRNRGHDAQVVAVLSPGQEPSHPFLESLEGRGIPVHRVNTHARAYLQEYRDVLSLTRRLGFGILHTHGYRADIIHGFTAKAAKVRRVSTLHGFVSGSVRDRIYEALQLQALRGADAVVAVSEPIAARLRHRGFADNVHLVRNALGPIAQPISRQEARNRLGLPQDAKLVAWVGRMSREKGPDLFVDALAEVNAAVYGVMVGDGPLLEDALSRASALGIRDRLIALGNVPDASRYFHAFDALAITSRTEGTPMAMLEAMQAGLPVIATMVGGIPDMVGHDEAWCCPPGDTRALGAAFEEALELSANTLARTMRARELVATQFGIASWLDEYERIYRDISEPRLAR